MNTLVEGAWALLLSQYNNEEDIVYGTTRSCRQASIEGAESMIGLLMNTVPVRVNIPKQTKMIDWLMQLWEQHTRMLEYIHPPLYEIQKWSDMTHGSPLFESLVFLEDYNLSSYMRSKGGRWINREFEYRGRTNYPLALIGYDDIEMLLRIEFDEGRFSQHTVKRILGHLQTILQNISGKFGYICRRDTHLDLNPSATNCWLNGIQHRQIIPVTNASTSCLRNMLSVRRIP